MTQFEEAQDRLQAFLDAGSPMEARPGKMIVEAIRKPKSSVVLVSEQAQWLNEDVYWVVLSSGHESFKPGDVVILPDDAGYEFKVFWSGDWISKDTVQVLGAQDGILLDAMVGTAQPPHLVDLNRLVRCKMMETQVKATPGSVLVQYPKKNESVNGVFYTSLTQHRDPVATVVDSGVDDIVAGEKVLCHEGSLRPVDTKDGIFTIESKFVLAKVEE